MTSSPVGVCALCRNTRELLDSHFLPKALYRLLRANEKRNPHPARLTSSGRQQTAFQASSHLLCAECESRFDQNGENWVMRHCYRGRGVFRLRAFLESINPSEVDAKIQTYSALLVPTIDIGRLVYFSTSVFWRASVQDWYVEGLRYTAIRLGEKYQEQIRLFLLGKAHFPDNAAVMVALSQLRTPALVFGFPDTVRVESGYCHRLHIPGIDFLMTVGKKLDEEHLTCILHSPTHPIFVCGDGDARAQREVLKLMGKVAPRWAEYPLVEGFESQRTAMKQPKKEPCG
jgi:hypothetical protein